MSVKKEIVYSWQLTTASRVQIDLSGSYDVMKRRKRKRERERERLLSLL
jgi:hypothetical protein